MLASLFIACSEDGMDIKPASSSGGGGDAGGGGGSATGSGGGGTGGNNTSSGTNTGGSPTGGSGQGAGQTGGSAQGGSGQGGSGQGGSSQGGSGQGGAGQGGMGQGGMGQGGGMGGCLDPKPVMVNLTASDDAFLAENQPNKTYNTNQLLIKRWVKIGKAVNRSVIRFDLASLPAKSQILSSKLCLTLDFGAGFNTTVDVHRLTKSWSESTVAWAKPWSKNGGDFDASATDTQLIPVFTTAGTEFCWDVLADVSDFHNKKASNHGWLAKDQSEPGNGGGETQGFGSSEHNNTSKRPRLEVSYCL